MSAAFALLCPGQGSQSAAMFELARQHPAIAAQIEAWDLPQYALPAAPASSLIALLQDAQALFDNRSAQPLVVASGLAHWLALRDALPTPTLIAGYSIGELTAYAVAGALEPANAIALAAKRAQAMSDCAAAGPRQVMAAVSSTGRAARQAIAAAGFHIAIDTPGSLIVGGYQQDLPQLQTASAAIGAAVTPLPISVASHTPLLQAAVPVVETILAAGMGTPQCSVLAGISAEAVSSRTQAITTLARQVEQTILWTACLDAVVEAGVTVCLELGPGGALSRMLRARHPHIACRSVSDFRTLSGVTEWVAREMQQ